MPDNKNTGKDADLSKKIAGEEGVKREEIAKDVARQMGDEKDMPSFSERVVKQTGVDPKELDKDLSEQMGPKKAKPNNKNAWIWIVIIIVCAIIAWLILGWFF